MRIHLITISIFMLIAALGGCGPSEAQKAGAIYVAKLRGNQQIAKYSEEAPSFVPKWYLDSLYVWAGSSTEGNFLTGYRAEGNYWIMSTAVNWLLGILCLMAIIGASLLEASDTKDAGAVILGSEVAVVLLWGVLLALWGILGLWHETFLGPIFYGWALCVSSALVLMGLLGYSLFRSLAFLIEQRQQRAVAAAQLAREADERATTELRLRKLERGN